jgi:hypothetical protein
VNKTFVAKSGVLSLMLAATPALAQTQVATLEDLRRELVPGDSIVIVQTAGESVKGRLLRFGETDLDVRIVPPPGPGEPRPELDIKIPFEAIHSLDRPPDATRNGALVGAGIGAGVAVAIFARAVAIDRNEMGEWAPMYLGLGAAFTGIGWLIGRAIDSGISKSHVRFDRSPKETTRIELIPFLSRGRGVALAVSF